MEPVYKRILLKLSGEVLAGKNGHGIDFDTVLSICEAVKQCSDMGTEIGLVVGGGNPGEVAQAARWTEQEQTIWACSQLL